MSSQEPWALYVGAEPAAVGPWPGWLEAARGSRAGALLAGGAWDVVLLDAREPAPPAELHLLSRARWYLLGGEPGSGLPSLPRGRGALALEQPGLQPRAQGPFQSAQRLLRALHLGRRSGVLHLEGEGERVELSLRDGELCGARARSGPSGLSAVELALGLRGRFRFAAETRLPEGEELGPLPELIRLPRPTLAGREVLTYARESARWQELIVLGPDGRRRRRVERREPLTLSPLARLVDLPGLLPRQVDSSGWEEPSEAAPSLAERVAREGSLEPATVRWLGLSALEALAGLHAEGLAHGGLDPRRLLVSESGVILSGVGVEPAGPRRDLLTLRYTAPELLEGEALSPEHDLFSLGALLAYAVTGRHLLPPRAGDPIGLAAPRLVGRKIGPLILRMLTGATSLAELRDQLLVADSLSDTVELGAGRRPSLSKVAPLPESIGGYRLRRLLGRGASSEVFEAEPEAGGARVALKLLPPESANDLVSRKRWQREADLLSSVRHPNVVRVLDAGQLDDRLYLVLELVEGESLADRLDILGRLESAEVSDIARQTLAALEVSAQAQVLHRDVKPENLLRTSSGRILLTDFGIARSSRAGVTLLTKPGTLLGTPLYMSPEQCRGEELDPRSDLYSLGATLYHLVCGAPPFVAETVFDLVSLQLFQPPPPLSERAEGVDPRLAAAIARAMSKEREDRFPDAAAFAAALG